MFFIVWIAAFTLPIVAGIIAGRIAWRKLKEKENRYPIILSVLAFVGATALTFGAFAVLIASNFRLER